MLPPPQPAVQKNTGRQGENSQKVWFCLSLFLYLSFRVRLCSVVRMCLPEAGDALSGGMPERARGLTHSVNSDDIVGFPVDDSARATS